MSFRWGPKPRWIIKLPEPKLFSEIFGEDAENNQDIRVSLSSGPFFPLTNPSDNTSYLKLTDLNK